MGTPRPEEKEPAKDPKSLLLQELKENNILNPVMVSYVNRAIKGQYGFPFHGFPIVHGDLRVLKVPKSYTPIVPFILKKQFANTFYIGCSQKHAPYHVSADLLGALNTKSLSKSTNEIMFGMKNKLFPSVMNFLYEWLLETYKVENGTLTRELREKAHVIATDLDSYYSELDEKLNNQKYWLSKRLTAAQETQQKAAIKNELSFLDEAYSLIELNENYNSHSGAVLPINSAQRFCVNDRLAFEKNECEEPPLAYPSILPAAVYELSQQQKLFKDYIDEKFSSSNTVVCETEEKSSSDTQRIMKRLVHFAYLPSGHFKANCNTATATFLQEAEYISAKQKQVPPINIVGASKYSIGSDQRMFFWNSRLHQRVVNLFINREYKAGDPDIKKRRDDLKTADLQELADNKDYILRIIETWPTHQYKSALEQILNQGHTPLSKVFFTQASNYNRQPALGRGRLWEVETRLAKLNEASEDLAAVELKDVRDMRPRIPR